MRSLTVSPLILKIFFSVFTLTGGFLFGSIGAMAQPDPPALSTLPSVKIRLDHTDGLQPAAASGLFRRFEVIDERSDTARIGIHNSVAFLGKGRKRQLVFDQPCAQELAGYLNRRFGRPGAPYTALVVLRTVWLSDANYIHEELVKDPDKSEEKTHIRLKAEIYATRDDSLFTAVFRFDTLQNTKRKSYDLKSTYESWHEDLGDILDEMADSASLVMARKEERKGRLIRRDEILQFNRSRFDNAISRDTVMWKGVYASFEEFRNNAPSIKDFEIKAEKKNSVLYVKDETGNYNYCHTAWGYCDGQDVYVMKDGTLYQASKEGKSFYFYATAEKKTSSTPSGLVPFGGPPPQTVRTPIITGPGKIEMMDMPVSQSPFFKGNSKITCIYTVDMDSGTVY